MDGTGWIEESTQQTALSPAPVILLISRDVPVAFIPMGVQSNSYFESCFLNLNASHRMFLLAKNSECCQPLNTRH